MNLTNKQKAAKIKKNKKAGRYTSPSDNLFLSTYEDNYGALSDSDCNSVSSYTPSDSSSSDSTSSSCE